MTCRHLGCLSTESSDVRCGMEMPCREAYCVYAVGGPLSRQAQAKSHDRLGSIIAEYCRRDRLICRVAPRVFFWLGSPLTTGLPFELKAAAGCGPGRASGRRTVVGRVVKITLWFRGWRIRRAQYRFIQW